LAIEKNQVVELSSIKGLNDEALSELAGLKPEKNRLSKITRWLNGESELSKNQQSKLEILNGNFPFRPRIANQKFTFIDLFAGIGGIRIPFQELGGKCVFTSEWDKFAKRTYFANFGDYPDGDITKIEAADIPSHDVLLAGFPCQAFSQAGLKKGFSDTRGTLFFEIQRIIRHHAPKVILLENVKQLRGHDQGRTLATILSVLRGETIDRTIEGYLRDKANFVHDKESPVTYHVGYRVLKARDFGVPQNRERIYIVALRDDIFNSSEVEQIFERAIASAKPAKNLGAVLIPDGEIDPKYTISDRLWTGHLRRRVEHRERGNGFGYSLFTAESPYCSTISARYYKDGSEILIDQSELGKNPRKITPREAARIQGFPEKFRISACSDAEIYKQFGNSVAVPVIKALADEITPLLKAVISARTERIAS